MIFWDYSELEKKMFEALKVYFEKLPPIANDEYENAFFDVIAQYGCGGEDYLVAEDLFSDLIEARSELIFEKLNAEDQEEIRRFYENHILNSSFYDEEQDEYNYTNEDLALSISQRFTSWVYDNYSIDDLLVEDEYEEEEYEEEEGEEEGDGDK